MSEADLSETQPEIQPYQTRQLLRVAIAAGAVTFAVGVYVANLDNVESAQGLPRAALVVTAVGLLLWVSEVRLERRLAQMRIEQAAFQARMERLLDARLERQRRWGAYADVLSDLGGIDGESSGEFPKAPLR